MYHRRLRLTQVVLYYVATDLMKLEEAGLLDRVADLEKRSAEQANELACLRSSLADCLRRISLLESNKGTALCQVRQSNMITHKRVTHNAGKSDDSPVCSVYYLSLRIPLPSVSVVFSHLNYVPVEFVIHPSCFINTQNHTI